MVRLLLTALVAGMLSLCGCTHFDMRKSIPWGHGNDFDDQPMKVVAVWTDTIMSQASETPRRGFGGRLMFYADEEGKPVKVKGTLTIYAFDETDRDPRNVKPDRKYVFTEEEFEKHHSENKLGHSYSVWLPWDRIGGKQTEVNLLVKFMPAKGGMVVSPQQMVLLHGAAVEGLASKPSTPPAMGTPQLPVQQANKAWDGSSSPTNPSMPVGLADSSHPAMTQTSVQPASYVAKPERKQMTSMTISVNPGPGNRLPTTTQSPMPSTPAGTSSSQSPPGQTLSMQSSARFGPDRLRPLGAPIAQLSRDRGPWQPTHAARPSVAASSPQSGQSP